MMHVTWRCKICVRYFYGIKIPGTSWDTALTWDLGFAHLAQQHAKICRQLSRGAVRGIQGNQVEKMQWNRATTPIASSWIRLTRMHVSPVHERYRVQVQTVNFLFSRSFEVLHFRTRLVLRSKAFYSPCYTIFIFHVTSILHSSKPCRSWILLAMRAWRSRWDKDHSCSCPSLSQPANRTTQSFA